MSGDCKKHLNNTCKHGNNIASLAATPAEARVDGDRHDDHDRHEGHDGHHHRDKHHHHDKHHHRDKHHHHDKHGKSRKRPVIVISNYGMGHAPTELGLKLVQTYLNLLDLDDRLPTAICLYGEGVKLAVEGSPVLEELRSLAAKDVCVIVCTTCLNFFGLMDQLAVGAAGSMKDIVELQWSVKKVITL